METATTGGDPHAQLQHLRAHRKFQRQEKINSTRTDWKTTITRDQSRQHIQKHIHLKINLKGAVTPAGKMDTPEGQQELKQFARRITNRERISGGDGHSIPTRLRLRMIRTLAPRLNHREFREYLREIHPHAIAPRGLGFPPWVQQKIRCREALRQLVLSQGGNPKRYRNARVMDVLACGSCRNLWDPQLVEQQQCPGCQNRLTDQDLHPIAVTPEPPNNIIGSVKRVRQRIWQYRDRPSHETRYYPNPMDKEPAQ